MASKPLKIIDPHVHLFDLQQGNYDWLKPENPPFWPDKTHINQNFSETDLVLKPNRHLAGFVHVEAGFDNQQPWREIDWLQQHCTLPFKSVAFADITATTFTANIRQLQQRESVVGIRHILDEKGFEVLAAKSTNKHFALLADKKLSFDAQLQVTDSQTVNELIKYAKRYSQLKIIINHGGTPHSQPPNEYQLWLDNLYKLAECPNMAIKLSGWEMVDRSWKYHWLERVLLDSLNYFGHSRVMLASNFPLCLFSKSYGELWQLYEKAANNQNTECFTKITYANAAKWYHF